MCLRPLSRTDAADWAALRGHPETARFQSWSRFSVENAHELINQSLQRRPDTPGEWYQFGIFLLEGGEMVGDCAIYCPAEDARQTEIGFTLGHHYLSKGYATEAVSLLVAWLLDENNKARIFAVTDGRNRPAHKLLMRLGFVREPPFDRLVWFKGEFGPESVWTRTGVNTSAGQSAPQETT